MANNIKYEITETSITKNNNVFVAFTCFVDNAESFKSAITVPHNTESEDVQKQIHDRVYNMTKSRINKDEQKNDHENKEKEKNDSCKALKALTDKEIGKKNPVKKPEKK